LKNWLFGYYIVEYEQNGEDRAKYRKGLIDEISKHLKNNGLKGFAPTSLRSCRLFYILYPQIQQKMLYPQIQQKMSVELQRAIGTQLALHTVISTNKDAIIAKIKNLKPATNREIIRNPLILEFLELKEETEYSEAELEQQILNHLQEFLMELGTGFCFEA
jgi:hypothetical protein